MPPNPCLDIDILTKHRPAFSSPLQAEVLKQHHLESSTLFQSNLRVLLHYLQPVGYIMHCDILWTSLFAHHLLVTAEEERGLSDPFRLSGNPSLLLLRAINKLSVNDHDVA